MHFEDDLHPKREPNIPALRNLFLSCPIYDDFNAQIWRFALLRARRTNLQNLGIANCSGNCSSPLQGHYSFVLGTFLSLFAAAVDGKFLKRRTFCISDLRKIPGMTPAQELILSRSKMFLFCNRTFGVSLASPELSLGRITLALNV